ncbi:unnamed protein product [Owenia fusiformis]|uniref:Dysbindin n=1 Tax=Owenia fusiformis TaxID=6347 RepID=A0A8J1UVE9_OWEFU|nr:unnamed protein product [Owenia fusiformis]CAH1778792.1 unnamed protein product [Owenia fusiformis]
MSVLQSLRGTFQNVQQGLSSAFTQKAKSPVKESRLEDINLDAGADLLNRYQQDWIKLHDTAEENAWCAQEVDGNISKVYLEIERQNEMLTSLSAELESLPGYLEQLQSATNMLASLEGSFEDIESQLLNLEDIIEQVELFSNKQHHIAQLQFYTQKKNTEVETMKVELAMQHASKVKDMEERRLKQLKDKQDALDEAFADDMKYFKTHGKTERQTSVSSGDTDSKVELDIADVALDADDQAALDDFLDEKNLPIDSGDINEVENIPSDTTKTPSDSAEVSGDSVQTPAESAGNADKIPCDSTENSIKTNDSSENSSDPVQSPTDSTDNSEKSVIKSSESAENSEESGKITSDLTENSGEPVKPSNDST